MMSKKKNKQDSVQVKKNTIFVYEVPKKEEQMICRSFQERLKLKRK